MSDEELDANKVIRILGHPVRIKIIELLATKGPLTWKELSNEVGTSTGSLYHHIDMLERLVEQDSVKRYSLTKLGLKVHEYMEAHPTPRDAAALGQIIKRGSATSIIQGLLIPRGLLYLLTSSRRKSALTCVGLSAAVLLLVALSRSEVLLLSFSPSSGMILSALSLGGSLLAVVGVGFVGTKMNRTQADPLVLLASAPLAFLPLALFSLVLRGLVTFGSLGVLADRNVLTALFALLQAWSACIVSAGMSVASGLRVERALPVSLALLYVTILVMFVQGLNFI